MKIGLIVNDFERLLIMTRGTRHDLKRHAFWLNKYRRPSGPGQYELAVVIDAPTLSEMRLTKASVRLILTDAGGPSDHFELNDAAWQMLGLMGAKTPLDGEPKEVSCEDAEKAFGKMDMFWEQEPRPAARKYYEFMEDLYSMAVERGLVKEGR